MLVLNLRRRLVVVHMDGVFVNIVSCTMVLDVSLWQDRRIEAMSRLVYV